MSKVKYNYFVQSCLGKIFFIVVPVLFPGFSLSTSRRNFTFIFNCAEKTIIYSETGFNFKKVVRAGHLKRQLGEDTTNILQQHNEFNDNVENL